MDLNPELQICFLLFQKWKQVRIVVLESIAGLMITIKNNLSNDNEEENHKSFVLQFLK
jgi:hypothetical protein